jgi:uncharacterized membrane protein
MTPPRVPGIVVDMPGNTGRTTGNTHPHRDQEVTEMSEHTIIAVSFPEQAKAYQALSELKGAALEGRVDVVAASVVTRDLDGRIESPDGVDNHGAAGMWGGSLIGMLIGVIGGPIGMLFGWTGGLLVGGAYDVRRAERSADALGDISASIPPGGTALVAEVHEVATEVVDKEMTALGGVVFRRDADEVLAEMEAAEDAYREAEKEAKRAAREKKRAERKAGFEERKTALKEKLGVS